MIRFCKLFVKLLICNKFYLIIQRTEFILKGASKNEKNISIELSAIVTISLSVLPQSLAITHESQHTKQQRTVLFDRSHGQTAGAAVGLVMVHFRLCGFNTKTRL